MAAASYATAVSPGGRSWTSIAPRAAVGLGLLVIALGAPALFSSTVAGDCATAAAYGIVGLSMNVLVGYTGQISLGQQGFVGLGAMTAANITASGVGDAQPFRFALGLAVAIIVGTGAALLLGVAALRVRGLYLALLTLVFGEMVTTSILAITNLDGRDAGVSANSPTFLGHGGPGGMRSYGLFLLAAALLLVVYVLDQRLVRSKAGRAMLALKENERAAEAFGVNVVSYKLLAFAFSGALAGLAGGLLAFIDHGFSQKNYIDPTGLSLALTFVVVAIVGGLGDRLGVTVAAVFFGLLTFLMQDVFTVFGGKNFFDVHKAYLPSLIGAVLLLQTVILNPGGLGQLLRPLARWLAGGPFRGHDDADYGEVTADVRA